jgi:hypothetical protein
MTVVVYGGGGGMEPTAPILVVDSGVVDGGDGGKGPTVSIILVDDGDGDHCRLQWRSIAAAAMTTIVDDGRH